MASENAVVMSAANLNTIETSITTLAENLTQVNVGMFSVDNKIKDVTESVKTIEDEIKTFMEEIRGSSITTNAKQSIMLSQTELEKKFGHYDKLRRNVSGLLQAADMSAVTKEAVKRISEEVIVGIPNYWLAPAYVALSAWITDDKELAEKVLKEAMNRDDEKTSLLFALIHARAGRNNTAVLWLNRYLEMQDPRYMERMIIVVLDAVSSGTFGVEGKTLIAQKLEHWLLELNNEESLKQEEINRIQNYLEKFKESVNAKYLFIENFTDNSNDIYSSLSSSLSRSNVQMFLNNVLYQEKLTVKKTTKIDEILNSLVFNYENEELELQKDIYKNKLIIETGGNITKAKQQYEESQLAYEEVNNLYTILTNVITGLTPASQETRKLALALNKELFTKAYKETFSNIINKETKLTIKIDDYNFITTNGQNEKELFNELDKSLTLSIQNEQKEVPLFDFKMALTTILGIMAFFFTLNMPILAGIIIIIVIGFNIYNLFSSFQKRKKIEKDLLAKRKDYQTILLNTIAEIVDYQFINNYGNQDEEKIYSYLNNLNYKDYLTSESVRNIQIGGNSNE
ncbi:MAG: hypothetical protein GX864_02180 [Mollicutes bacterium]|nr:hypothetical protein [Mollicutes bacterium]